MPRTIKGTTQYLVNALLKYGWTKWRLAYHVEWSKKQSGNRQTWQTVDSWSRGRWEANRYNLQILQDLYFNTCRDQKVGLFSPIENKEVDSSNK
jgi:hypothetical protein